jgi:hypothetical protein
MGRDQSATGNRYNGSRFFSTFSSGLVVLDAVHHELLLAGFDLEEILDVVLISSSK